MVNAT